MSSILELPPTGDASLSTSAPIQLRERILIVDDEEIVQKLFADFLSDQYICETAFHVFRPVSKKGSSLSAKSFSRT